MTTDKPDYGKHIDRGDGFTHHAGDDCHPDNLGKTAEIYQTTAPATGKPCPKCEALRNGTAPSGSSPITDETIIAVQHEAFHGSGIAPAQEKPKPLSVEFSIEGKEVSRDEFEASLNAPVQEDINLCPGCNTMKHLDPTTGLCRRCTPPSQSERELDDMQKFLDALYDEFKRFNPTTRPEDWHDRLNALIEQEKRAAVQHHIKYTLQCDHYNAEAGHKWSSGDWRKFMRAELEELTE